MAREVEISRLDLRYQEYRMRNGAQEARLLVSITERGIEEPLEGVDREGASILLNGFKRYRCARRLGIATAPYVSMGEDEAKGILSLLRIGNHRSLSILEQAGFIDELKKVHRMNVAEIAQSLCRSKGWVSMRLGLIGEMTEGVREKLLSGAFPVYPYMYTLRRFMRMNSASKAQVEEFVVGLSGKKLSVREIEQLAHGYFQGPESFREQIRNGNVALPLEWVKQGPEDGRECNAHERALLKDMEILQSYMQRVMGKSLDPKLKSPGFHARANLLAGGMLSRAGAFLDTLKGIYDRSGKA